ncbi:ankyrin repeat [Trichoderma arundinaceum]|uniref:Ankyrin repeat n=1 Tax=Trichoderma arundinaceum TaxID=490622 RepID=A0A395N7J8_TRIAR|nr:ankyrin repeat [Trichoderma arundinaceum]
MSGRSMSMLVIPTQSSSPNNQPTTPNGRPPTWSTSAQRKMARLYLYTTLPVEKIRAIINAHSPDRTIKQSSANKRLQLLFDKEPRWLHPHDVEDMGRRVTELANSPTQLRAASEMQFPSSHQGQDQSPLFGRSNHLEGSMMAGSRPSSASPSDECSESTHSNDACTESQPALPYALSGIPEEGASEIWGNRGDFADFDRSDSPFASFLHKTTFMTESSANTTGTFREHLQGYTEPYVQVVKRLVKRFTSPALGQPGMPGQRGMYVDWDRDWIAGEAQYSTSTDCILLPGDFLQPDFATRCAKVPGIAPSWLLLSQHAHFTWVNQKGITNHAVSLLSDGITAQDAVLRDCFGNTVLHFLAVCAFPSILIQALKRVQYFNIINLQNTAGQTFMHLLNCNKEWGKAELGILMNTALYQGFDLHARDCYGRSAFHILSTLGVLRCELPLLGSDPREFPKRDAFGKTPLVIQLNRGIQDFAGGPIQGTEHNAVYSTPDPALDPTLSNNPSLSKESRGLQKIRASLMNPYYEDESGRNGLHCLAMATLSLESIQEKYKTGDLTQKHSSLHNNRHSGDSSEEVLQFRFSILRNLLDSGLDPNHRDIYGNTPLMAFAGALPEEDEYKIGPAMLKLLILKGADVNARNRTGDTALHVAVRFHRKLAVRALVEGGANVHVLNADQQGLLAMCDMKLNKDPGEYGKYSACRAWLSGQANAVQHPSLFQQWLMDAPSRD